MKKFLRIIKRMKKKTKVIILVVLVALLGLGGFLLFGGEKAEKVKEKIIPAKKQKVEPSDIKVVNTNSKTRPYAVMINNLAVARPLQSGIDKAYIMYEFIVEGGITRYLAVFKDVDVDRIGPVRSARHYFIDYALENDAIYVHHGQSPQAQAEFGPLGVDRIEATENKTGWRDKSLKVSTEHRLFTSTSKLANGIGSKRTEFTDERYKDNYGLLLNYSTKSVDLASVPNNQVANKVSIVYSNSTTSSYEYDPEAKVYKRFVNGKAHTEYVTKQQLTFKNIITYQVHNYPLNDGSGKDRQGLDNVGSGTGYYISEGYAIPIKWEKTSRATKTKYTLEDGTELKVNDGKTFIQVQPQGKALTIEA